MKTIADLELEVSDSLDSIHHFDGFHAKATAYGPQRKKKSSAPETAFQPGRDRFVIEYHAVATGLERRRVPAPAPSLPPERSRERNIAAPTTAKETTSKEPDRAADLIRALAHAEAQPGFHFVGLKWFRDVGLTQHGLSWSTDPKARYAAVNSAIGEGHVITEKLANPNRPEFPTTVLKLNRSHPTVQAVVGQSARPNFSFPLVTARGEPVSHTVIRDRGQR